MSVHFADGKVACYRLQAVGAVERMVGVRAGKAVRLRRFADHCAPRVVDGARWVCGFGRGNVAIGGVYPPEPVIVWGDCPEDGWLSGPQGDDLGEDALEFRAEDLRRRSRARRIELRPVNRAAAVTVARVVVTVKGGVVGADADDNDVRIGERLAPLDVGLQLFEQTVGLQPIGLGEVPDIHGVAGCLGDAMGIPDDGVDTARTVVLPVE